MVTCGVILVYNCVSYYPHFLYRPCRHASNLSLRMLGTLMLNSLRRKSHHTAWIRTKIIAVHLQRHSIADRWKSTHKKSISLPALYCVAPHCPRFLLRRTTLPTLSPSSALLTLLAMLTSLRYMTNLVLRHLMHAKARWWCTTC